MNKVDEPSHREVNNIELNDDTQDVTRNHLLIASMLKDSLQAHDISELDRSRNDVVPQKTMLEPTVNEDDEKMQSITSSEKEGDNARVHADNNDHHVDSF